MYLLKIRWVVIILTTVIFVTNRMGSLDSSKRYAWASLNILFGEGLNFVLGAIDVLTHVFTET